LWVKTLLSLRNGLKWVSPSLWANAPSIDFEMEGMRLLERFGNTDDRVGILLDRKAIPNFNEDPKRGYSTRQGQAMMREWAASAAAAAAPPPMFAANNPFNPFFEGMPASKRQMLEDRLQTNRLKRQHLEEEEEHIYEQVLGEGPPLPNQHPTELALRANLLLQRLGPVPVPEPNVVHAASVARVDSDDEDGMKTADEDEEAPAMAVANLTVNVTQNNQLIILILFTFN
jgi:hypothetical protein